MNLIPSSLFLTEGVGVHKEKLISFELALKDAGVNKINLAPVSSIVPPSCKIIDKKDGLACLKPGMITFCVVAYFSSNEVGRTMRAAIAMSIPKDRNTHGYLSEYHTFDENEKVTEDYAKYLAGFMLANSLGIEADETLSWYTNKEIWENSGKISKLESTVKSAIVKPGSYTTVFVGAIFLF